MKQDSWKEFYKDIKQKNSNKDICPICNKREIYTKTVMVKNGYSVQNPDGSYYFKSNGMIEKQEEYWTCKKCTKELSAKEYNKKLIEIFNNRKI